MNLLKNYLQRILLFILLGFPMLSIAQENIEGQLLDDYSDIPIVGAIIRIDSTYYYAVSDIEGRFKFNVVEGKNLPVTISHIGYETTHGSVSSGNGNIFVIEPKTYLSEEVNITATRADLHSAVAYTNIDKEEIEKNNIGRDIPFLLNTTPSVVVTSDAGTGVGYTGIRIRGSDATRINVTMNGVPVNDAESHQVYWVDLPDLASSVDNLQIQRGIGTSTNGAGAFGGSINILTNKLESKAYGSLSSSAGSFNTFKNTVSFGSGLLQNSFAVEGRLSKITSDGYIDRATSDLQSYYLSAGYYGKKNSLRAVILSGKEKTYQAWYGVPEDSLNTNRTYNPAGKYTDENGNEKYYDNQTDNYKQDYYQLIYSGEVNQNVNVNAALHYTKGKGYYEEYWPYDDMYGNGELSHYGIDDFISGTDTISSTDLIRQKWLDNDFYGFTFSANYSKNKIQFTLGGAGNEFKGKHYDEIIWMKYNFGITPQYRYSSNDADKTDFNIFAKANYEVTDRLNVFGDIQYRTVGYEFEGFDDQLQNSSQKINLNFLNPKAGLSFELNSTQRIYASVAYGHKEPTRDDYVSSSPYSRPEPEKMIDMEAGYQYSGERIKFGINFYNMNYQDQLVLTGKINDVGEYPRQNVDKSSRSGIEFEISWNALKNLSISGNITLSRNKIDEFEQYIDSSDDAGNYTQLLVMNKNTDISFSPNIISSAVVEYSPVKNLFLSLTAKYVGKQFLDNTSNESRNLDPYFVNDVMIRYKIKTKIFKELELKLAAYNLLSEKYESNGYTYSYYYNGVFYNSNSYFPQAGVSWLGGVVVKF